MERKRESSVVSLSIVVVLLIVAPAFAFVPYTDFTGAGGATGDGVYEFNPWGNSGGGPAGEEADDWTEVRGGGPGAWVNSGGTLYQSNTSSNGWARWDLNPVSPSDPVGAVTAWTMEISAQVTSEGTQVGSGDTPYAGLYFGIQNNDDDSTELVIRQGEIRLRTASGWVLINASPNNDTYHTTRLVRYSSGEVQVYRDGGKVSLDGSHTTATNTAGLTSFVIFGDNAFAAAGTDGLTCDIEYLAFDLGNSYVPEPTTMILLAAGSLLCILRKRR